MAFYLLDKGNAITSRDLAIGILRITVHVKPFFKDLERIVSVMVDETVYQVKYTKRNHRSDLLHLGNDILNLLGVDKKCRLKFTCLDSGQFLIEKVFFFFLIQKLIILPMIN